MCGMTRPYCNAPWRQIIHDYELDVLRWVGEHAPAPTVLDVGANEGQYALAVREVLGEGAQLVCFEPNPACLPALKKAAGDHGTVFPIALSSSPGRRAMYMKI